MSTTETFSTAGTGSWTCPTGVTSVQVTAVGAGGGGSGDNPGSSGTTGQAGGGGGAQVTTTLSVTPGTVYAYSIGAGGFDNFDGTGTDGGDTTLGVTMAVAHGGNGGNQNTPGAGGTGSATGTSTTVTIGADGSAGDASLGGDGGDSGSGAAGGLGGDPGSPSTGDAGSGDDPGGGGGGAFGDGSLGGSAGDGQITLVYTAVPSDPILYYTMDNADISGTTITDRGSGGHNGTLIGSPTTGATGKIGQAVSFSGSGQYATAAAPGGSDGDFTVAVWFQAAATMAANTRILETKWSSEWKIGRSGAGGTTLDFFVGGTGITGGAYTVGDWHHLVGVYTRSTASAVLYVDGVSVASGTVGTPSAHNVLGVAGTNTGGNLFDGLIDEARLYDRALSADEVAALYAYTGASAPAAPLFRRALGQRSGSRGAA